MAARQGWRAAARGSYWREADARLVIEEWRRSGDNLATFCRRNQLKPERVARWARRLDEVTSESLKFHPVELVHGEAPVGALALEVELPRGEMIRVPSGFALEDLRRVLVALDERA